MVKQKNKKMNTEQKEYIREHYMEQPYSQIAKHLGINKSSVQMLVHRNGWPVKRNRVTLDLDEVTSEYIVSNYQTMAYSEIGKHIGLTEKQVEAWVRNHIKDRVLKKRVFNEDYFETINTPDRAYWLGFIYADGWISIHKRNNSDPDSRLCYEFGMELQRRDEYMLHKLNELLGGQHIVKQLHNKTLIVNNSKASETDSSVLRVYSKKLVSDLMTNGIDLHKSYSDVFPVVEDRFFFDFLRGYIDGDGYVTKQRKYLDVGIASSNDGVLKYIQSKLLNDYGIHTSIYCEQHGQYMPKYTLRCFRKDSVAKLFEHLYANKDAIKLMRKYLIFEDFYGLAA